jgi:hypothetical protein
VLAALALGCCRVRLPAIQHLISTWHADPCRPCKHPLAECAVNNYYTDLGGGDFSCTPCTGDQISTGSGSSQVCGCPDTDAYTGQTTATGCGECAAAASLRSEGAAACRREWSALDLRPRGRRAAWCHARARASEFVAHLLQPAPRATKRGLTASAQVGSRQRQPPSDGQAVIHPGCLSSRLDCPAASFAPPFSLRNRVLLHLHGRQLHLLPLQRRLDGGRHQHRLHVPHHNPLRWRRRGHRLQCVAQLDLLQNFLLPGSFGAYARACWPNLGTLSCSAPDSPQPVPPATPRTATMCRPPLAHVSELRAAV